MSNEMPAGSTRGHPSFLDPVVAIQSPILLIVTIVEGIDGIGGVVLSGTYSRTTSASRLNHIS